MNDLEMNDLEAIELENQQNDRPNFTPTPEEIRAMCLEIQKEWSPAEERRRRVIGNPEVDTRLARGLTGPRTLGNDDAP